MNYYFGFSWMGLIVFLLPMIPNIFYFLIPGSDVSIPTALFGIVHVIITYMDYQLKH
jgi:hypothetical protein